MEMLDAEKTKRIEQLELTIARLESTLSYFVTYGQPPAPHVQPQAPPPLPPKGHPSSSGVLPPLPPKRPPPLSAALHLYYTPQPPGHHPIALCQSPGAGPSATSAFTPQLPQHPPPPLEETPPPPRHRPLPLPPSPRESHPIMKRRIPLCSAGKLPSSAINKHTLSTVDSVVHANLDLLGKEGKTTAMASALAREAYFGKEVMAQCTAQGYGDEPGLPATELGELKEEIRRLYPV